MCETGSLWKKTLTQQLELEKLKHSATFMWYIDDRKHYFFSFASINNNSKK